MVSFIVHTSEKYKCVLPPNYFSQVVVIYKSCIVGHTMELVSFEIGNNIKPYTLLSIRIFSETCNLLSQVTQMSLESLWWVTYALILWVTSYQKMFPKYKCNVYTNTHTWNIVQALPNVNDLRPNLISELGVIKCQLVKLQ